MNHPKPYTTEERINYRSAIYEMARLLTDEQRSRLSFETLVLATVMEELGEPVEMEYRAARGGNNQ